MKLMQRILGTWYDVPMIRLIVELLFVILPVAFLIRTFGFGLYQVPTGSMETTLLVGERFFADKLSYWFRKPVRGEIIAFDDPTHRYSSNPVTNLWQRYVSWNVSNWTKRVIGVPGDHVKGVIEEDHPVVYVNDKKLDENGYLNKYPIIMVWKSSQSSPYRYQQREYDLRSFDPAIPWDKQIYYKINPSLIYVDPHTLESQVKYPGVPSPTGEDVFDIKLGENQYWVMGDNRKGSSDSRVWGPLDGKLIHGKIIYRIWSMDTDESWWFIDLLKNPINFWKKVRWNRCFQWVK
jgi:signal peptidase I